MNYSQIEIGKVIEKLEMGKSGSRKKDILDLLETLNHKNKEGEMDLWLQSWIFPRLFRLIPELKGENSK